ARFGTPIMEGVYLDEFLEDLGDEAPDVQPGDMDLIGQPLDVLTINGYCPANVIPYDNKRGYRVLPVPRSYPTYVPKWLRFGPNILYWVPRFATEVWDAKAIYITENGCACDDVQDADGNVYDTDRVLYLRQHFIAMSRAIAEGYPLKGYFLWSFIDNFEWAEGYSQRFGITWCNFETLQRVPKFSARWYGEVIKNGHVV
ncbi:MAG: family 1 glycosylhydrolase, partial [Planctomycetota bacterium]